MSGGVADLSGEATLHSILQDMKNLGKCASVKRSPGSVSMIITWHE